MKRNLLILAVLAAAAAVVYSNTFVTPFIFDGATHILNNETIESIGGIIHHLRSVNRSVTYTTFNLNYFFHEYEVWGYHLVNLILHILTSFVVFLFLKELFGLEETGGEAGKRNTPASFAAALIFAVHPVHTQAVTYIYQRATVLAALFFVLSFYLYLKGKKADAERPAYRYYAASAAAGVLAVCSKANAAMLPAVIITAELVLFRERYRGRMTRWIVYALFSALLVVVLPLAARGSYFLGMMMDAYRARGFTPWERILTESRVAVHYLGLLFYPHPSRLRLNYDMESSSSLLNPPTTVYSIILLGVLLGFFIFLLKKHRVMGFLGLWFYMNLVIESTFVPLETIFEHRLYLPSIGIIAFCVSASVMLTAKKKKSGVLRFAPAVLLLVLVPLLGFWTYSRNKDWRSEVSIWEDTVAKSPESRRAQFNLGIAYHRAGRIEEARNRYRKSLEMDRHRYRPYFFLGMLDLREGDYESALENFDRTLMINPPYYEAGAYRGEALKELGRTEEAERVFESVLRETESDLALLNLGKIKAERGKTMEAEMHFLRALEDGCAPVDVYYNLALLYQTSGRIEEALMMYTTALEIDPGHYRSLTNRGNIHFGLGGYAEAAEEYKRALSIEPDAVQVRYNLALVMEKLKRYGEALQHFERTAESGYMAANCYKHMGLIQLNIMKNKKRAGKYLGKALEGDLSAGDRKRIRALIENLQP